nr:reverse transcriptase domain-containing protein [Tanacetum cinerariifolium]
MKSKMWNLTMKTNDLAAYTQRFQELTMMCSKMDPEEEDRVEKFIGGLPNNIQWNAIFAKPTRLQDAVRIAINLMDQKLKGYYCWQELRLLEKVTTASTKKLLLLKLKLMLLRTSKKYTKCLHLLVEVKTAGT